MVSSSGSTCSASTVSSAWKAASVISMISLMALSTSVPPGAFGEGDLLVEHPPLRSTTLMA